MAYSMMLGGFYVDGLYLVMPAYNEAENIEAVVRSWYPIVEDKGENSRFIVADSGSTDHTHLILTRLCQEFGKLEIISDTGTQHGPKVIALYDYAVKNGADYIFQTDSDGQTSPDEFQEFWNLRKEHDAVIGKRLSRGDGRVREFVEKVLCAILRLYFNVSIPDANAPFRLMKSDLVGKYLEKLPEDYPLPNVMLTTYFVRFQENVVFKSITFRPRQGGVNSVNLVKIVRIGWRVLYDFYTLKKGIGR